MKQSPQRESIDKSRLRDYCTISCMRPPSILNYHQPTRERQRWFGIAAAVVLLHWVLLFGWGLAFNDAGRGYLYCRIVVPLHFDLTSTPGLFSVGGTVLIALLGIAAQWLLRIAR